MPTNQPDYNKILEHLTLAQTQITNAVASMHSMDKMSHLESYVLGHLRGAEAVLNEAVSAIQKTEAFKRKRLATEKEPEA